MGRGARSSLRKKYLICNCLTSGWQLNILNSKLYIMISIRTLTNGKSVVYAGGVISSLRRSRLISISSGHRRFCWKMRLSQISKRSLRRRDRLSRPRMPNGHVRHRVSSTDGTMRVLTLAQNELSGNTTRAPAILS